MHKRSSLFIKAALFANILGFALLTQASNAELIAQGEYLTQMGDCVSCHTAKDGKPFAGGRAINTPFGNIYAPNITPDKKTGLGSWRFDDFWQALHHGKGRNGQFLYPAFSYTSFTKVTKKDAKAMFAYLQSLPAVESVDLEHQLSFPYNIRPILFAWRTLYFQAGEYQADSAQSEQWNRGAYIVEGLGHCNECHTARNSLGAMTSDPLLVGGEIPLQGWYAPNLSTKEGGGLEGWSNDDIIQLLKSGSSAKGAVFGPMAEVVRNSTQYLTDADLMAVAVYLQSLPAPKVLAPKATERSADYALGKTIFADNCATCHGDDGQGSKGIYPSMTGSATITEPTGMNAVRMVLLGGFAPSTQTNPEPYSMPPFAYQFNDAEVAAVVNYIRQSWGNMATPVNVSDVARSRLTPTE